ncbi:MAG: DUF4185 domain-containing protein [Planctomycetota bacterium]
MPRFPSSCCAIILALLAACSSHEGAGGAPRARAWTEAEGLFHRDPRWLGGDGALTIPLGGGRTLWLFGDSFVATGDPPDRRRSVIVRNSVAVQRGMDPRTAAMAFCWRVGPDGRPTSFFADHEGRWWWPGHGVRLDGGPLVVFLLDVRSTPGEGLGFAGDGYAVAIVDDPDAPPSQWRPRVVPASRPAFDVLPATAVVRDGDHVVAVAIRQHGAHAGALVRWPVAELARGETAGAEWWTGTARGWVPERSLGRAGPAPVMDDAGSECSLHRDPVTGDWLHVATRGFGATTIVLRRAPALTGPWSEAVEVYRPPESDGPRPFVYAAKAHPELRGPDPGDLVLTYATNSFEFGDLFTEAGQERLAWPRLVVLPMGR